MCNVEAFLKRTVIMLPPKFGPFARILVCNVISFLKRFDTTSIGVCLHFKDGKLDLVLVWPA